MGRVCCAMGVQEEDRSITTPETAGQAMSTEISDVTSSAEETSADMEWPERQRQYRRLWKRAVSR